MPSSKTESHCDNSPCFPCERTARRAAEVQKDLWGKGRARGTLPSPPAYLQIAASSALSSGGGGPPVKSAARRKTTSVRATVPSPSASATGAQ
jgi:hypothetical protein